MDSDRDGFRLFLAVILRVYVALSFEKKRVVDPFQVTRCYGIKGLREALTTLKHVSYKGIIRLCQALVLPDFIVLILFESCDFLIPAHLSNFYRLYAVGYVLGHIVDLLGHNRKPFKNVIAI